MASSKAPSGLVIERPAEGVCSLSLDRPSRRNALHQPLVQALIDAFADRSVEVFILGSTDPRCFCAGADLSIPDAERSQVSDRLYALYETMVLAPAPIIAAVCGPAVGGGAQLLLASDLRIGGEQTRVRFAGPGHGLAVGAWGLPSLVGRGRALNLCLTMRTVAAAEAQEIGLLDELVEDPYERALELARQLAALHAPAVSRVKQVIRTGSGLQAALAAERAGNRRWSGSTEGLNKDSGADGKRASASAN